MHRLLKPLIVTAALANTFILAGCGGVGPENDPAAAPEGETTRHAMANCGTSTCTGSQNLCCENLSGVFICTGSSYSCTTNSDCTNHVPSWFCTTAHYCVPSNQWQA